MLSAAEAREDSETARKASLLADLDVAKQDAETTEDDFIRTYVAAESNLAALQGALKQRTDAISTIRVANETLESSCTDIVNRIKDTEIRLASTVTAASSAASEFKHIIKGRLALVASLEAEVSSLRRMHRSALKTTAAVRAELAEVEKRCATSVAQARHRGVVAEKLHQRKLEKIGEEKGRLGRHLHQLCEDLEALRRRRTQLEQELADTNARIELAAPHWELAHSEKAAKETDRWAARNVLEREWTTTCTTRDAAKAVADRDDAEATDAEDAAKQDKAALEDMRATFCTTLAGLRNDNSGLESLDRTLSADIETQRAEAAKTDDAIQELPTLHAERMEAMSDRLEAVEAQIRHARAARQRSSGALLSAQADYDNARDTLELMTMTADGLESHLEAARGRTGTGEDAAGLLVDLENG